MSARPARRPRSDETRARIVRAAGALFGEHGYERTTIRLVAARAEIDPAMVMRYFGNKEGLFAAVAAFDLRLPRFAELPRATLGDTIVRHFLARWDEDAGSGLPMLMRAACSNAAARARMREIFASQLLPQVEALVGDRAEALLRAELVGSQLIGVAFCRFVLATPNLGGADTELIVARLAPVVQGHLLGGAA